jgi:molybdopterin converting factor small subunit
MPQVEVPPRYRGPTNGRGQIEVDGATVRGCLEAVEVQYPGFLELVFDADGELRRYVRLFVNDEALDRDAADAPVAVSDRVQILASVAGG